MKNKLFFAGILGVALIFGLFLTGCPTETDSNPEPKVIAENVQVYRLPENFSGPFPHYTGTGTVKLQLKEGEYSEVGTITLGKLTVTLPAPMEDAYLTPLSEDDIPPGVTVSPTNARGFGAVFGLFDGEKTIGSLIFGKIALKGFNVTTIDLHTIQYIYFPQNTSITGRGSMEKMPIVELPLPTTTVTIDLDGKPGWHDVYIYGSGKIDPSDGSVTDLKTFITSDVTEAPSGLQWIVVPASNSELAEDRIPEKPA